MVINDAFNLASEVSLVLIQYVVIDQGNLIYGVGIRVLSPELVPEVKVVLRDLAVLEMLGNLQVAEEVLASAVNDGNPLLVELLGVKVSQADGADS